MTQKEVLTFDEFYHFYLSEHKNVNCRRLHFFGAWLGIFFLLLAAARLQFFWLPAGVVSGYFFSWIGHFFFEKNRPASFKRPLFSFFGDCRMFQEILSGKIKI